MQLLANDYPLFMALGQFFGVPSIFGWTICQLVQVSTDEIGWGWSSSLPNNSTKVL